MKSMTGFGRGEYVGKSYSFKVEIKTVNHRYNDISIRMPKYMNFLEDRIKREIKKDISRGRVDVYINLEYVDESSLNIDVDLPLAMESMKALSKVRDQLHIQEDITIADVLDIGDIIRIERQIIDEDELWSSLEKALIPAIEDAISMKEVEGEHLKLDMLDKLSLVESLVKNIEDRAPLVVVDHRDKLEDRIKNILEDVDVDQEKLANEIAVFADKSNIDEEVIRLNSHIQQFRNICKEEEPVGRKLDFLIQEMNREINTIGSKSGDIEITNNVVEVKSEIEKIREQVQNIE